MVPSKQRQLSEEVEKQLTALLEHYPANPIMPKSQRPTDPPKGGGTC